MELKGTYRKCGPYGIQRTWRAPQQQRTWDRLAKKLPQASSCLFCYSQIMQMFSDVFSFSEGKQARKVFYHSKIQRTLLMLLFFSSFLFNMLYCLSLLIDRVEVGFTHLKNTLDIKFSILFLPSSWSWKIQVQLQEQRKMGEIWTKNSYSLDCTP